MIYVMSDLHGMYNEFIQMLELIKFSEEDTLYILGDIIDRGDKPLEIVEYITEHENIILLRGNHEQMYMDYYKGRDYGSWTQYNGGHTTWGDINLKQMEVDYDYRKRLYDYFCDLPLYKVVEVKDKKFILVHAGLCFPDNYNDMELDRFLRNQKSSVLLWDRDNIGEYKHYKDYVTIQGHTPTPCISNGNEIVYKKGNIYIDCGVCYEIGKLGCLRLDDMREFYVENDL